MPRTLQKRLFQPRTSLAPPTSGLFAQIVFNRPIDGAFTYGVPATLADRVRAGQRVVAPFGAGDHGTIGYCVDVTSEPPDRPVKSLVRALDDEPLLTPSLLRLTRWMADYYLCPWGQVLDAIVPAGAKASAGTRLRTFLQAVPEQQVAPSARKLTPKQLRALTILREHDGLMEISELARAAGCTEGVLTTLVQKGYAQQQARHVDQFQPAWVPPSFETPLTPNPDQANALTALEQALSSGGFRPFLLHGVTGSGKTEIYLQAIDQAVRQGKEALVLVPEISLTPQTIQRFRGRFPRVAVLHSHLSDAERGRYWRQIAGGAVQVIVGARSAVFAPARRLGLIVVDEEHETSFKQESAPRYHGRDVAVMRAQLEGIPIVLGSATPSLETWHNAQTGRYTLLNLPKRVLDRPLPNVALIDLRHEPPGRGRYRAISPTLHRAMQQALTGGGQIILLLNRRGFDTYLLCPACGYVVKCRFCDVSLTHHRQREAALCHYCGYEQDPPTRCPDCGLAQISYRGLGTEKLEAEIAQKFPGIPAERMDSDSMRRRGSHGRVLDAFRQGEIRILFGTQMIAKGLDFPNVTLVGVVNADTALYLPDFRAAERTFQLLAQVAGRTGRGTTAGRVLVQTYNPEHACISLATRHDYARFADQELQVRRQHGYPPFSRMARVVIRSRDQEAAKGFADQLAESFRGALEANGGPALRLLGPAEVPIFKLKGYYRYHFQLQSTSSVALHALLKRAVPTVRPPKGVSIAVDVDPLSMF